MRALLLAGLLSCSLLIFSSLIFAAEPLLLEEARLVPLDSSPPGFGRSVAIDGDVAVVGATMGGGMPEQGLPGAAYVFERQRNGTWHRDVSAHGPRNDESVGELLETYDFGIFEPPHVRHSRAHRFPGLLVCA